jgi:CheY-like chemotaxis protein
VAVACNGLEALAAVAEVRPDVVVTDVSMPVMDGLEFLLRLRSDVPPPLPPVIVCSGFEGAEEDALRLGAFHFALKPVDPTSLLSMVELAARGQVADAEGSARTHFVAAARANAGRRPSELLAGVEPADLQFGGRESILRSAFRLLRSAWIEVLLVDNGPLRSVGRSRGCPSNVTTDDAFYSSRALASGGSLVLSDAVHAFSGIRAIHHGIRFFVGVPLVYDGVPIGALCMMDREPRGLTAEDLLVLETIGRAAANSLPVLIHDLEIRAESAQRQAVRPSGLRRHARGRALPAPPQA